PGDRGAHEAAPDPADRLGGEPMLRHPDQAGPGPLVLALGGERREDAPAQVRRPHPGARVPHPQHDVTTPPETAEEGDAAARTIDRAGPTRDDGDVGEPGIEEAEEPFDVGGAVRCAFEPRAHSAPEPERSTALPEGDPAVVGRPVVVDEEPRIRD